MADSGRKGFGEQAKEKVTPDSQKTYAQKASETATGVVDNVAATIQPNSEKGTAQKAGDKAHSTGKSTEKEADTYLESAQNAASTVAHTVSETLINAADYVTGKGQDAKGAAEDAAKK